MCQRTRTGPAGSWTRDEYSKGIQVFHQANNLDALMEFLARYVHKVHANKFLKRKLIKEPGSSFLDLISPIASDIAYVTCLVKNSGEVSIRMRMKTRSNCFLLQERGRNGCMGRLCGVRSATKIITTGHSQIGVMHNKTWTMRITGCYAMHGRSGSRTRAILWCSLSNNSTRKTIKSVLRTREESEVAQQQVGNQQGNNDNGGGDKNAGAHSLWRTNLWSVAIHFFSSIADYLQILCKLR